jgi:hypothetical protein
LDEDAKRADDLLAKAQLKASVALYEFNELEYMALCWSTHGSTLVGLRTTNIDIVPAQCAMRMHRIHDFAICNVQIVLQELKLFDQKDFDGFVEAAQGQIATVKI